MVPRRELGGIILVAMLFIVVSALSARFSNEISMWLDIGVWGMIIYALFEFVATVIAPVNTLPFLPIAVSLWGPLVTALLSIAGWFVGSLVAFALARKWGRPIVSRLINMRKLSFYEKAVGSKHIFWNIIFLRMAIPVDLLSYALGIFSTVGWRTYAVAT